MARIKHLIENDNISLLTNNSGYLTSDNVEKFETIIDITAEPTGFTDPENISIIYDAINRTITLNGNVEAYYKGIKIEELIHGWTSESHAEGSGTFFLQYNENDGFTFSNVPFNFKNLLIALIFRDTSNFCIRECHGLMQWQTHKHLHETVGTYLRAGGDLSNYTINSTIATNRRPHISASKIIDEDLISNLLPLSTNNYSWLFLSSTNTTNMITDNPEIISITGTRPNYNKFENNLWIQAQFENNFFGKIFVLAIPTSDDAPCNKVRYVFIQPQEINSNLNVIQALTPANVNIGHITPALSEFCFIGEIIIRFSGNNWRIVEVNKLLGTRRFQVSTPTGNFLSVVNTDESITGDGTLGAPLAVNNRYISLPLLIKKIQLKNDPALFLQPLEEYTYTFDLGDEYDSIVISEWDWISRTNNKTGVPSFNLGFASFNTNVLYISNGETFRIFEKVKNTEFIGNSTLNSDWGQKVTGTSSRALGHGLGLNECALNIKGSYYLPIDKLEVNNVWLDGNELKIKIANLDDHEIYVGNYIGKKVLSTESTLRIGSIKCIGENAIFLIGRTLNSIHFFSLNRGQTFIPENFGISAGIVASTVKTDGNNYFIAFIDYFKNAKSYVYDFNERTITQKSSLLFDGDNYRLNNDFGGPGSTGRDNFGFDSMAWKGNIGLLATEKGTNGNVALLKTTNDWETVVEECTLDEIPNTFPTGSDSSTAIICPQTYIIDNNTWYWGSQYWGIVADVNQTINFIAKTTNGGTSWTNILSLFNHLDFSYAVSFRFSVSDDGNIICVVAILNNPLAYPEGIGLYFNISKDGGTNWLYSDTNWKLVVHEDFLSYMYTSGTRNPRRIMKSTLINYNAETEIITVGYRGENNRPYIKTSFDDGLTWTDREVIDDGTAFHFFNNASISVDSVTANDYFMGFTGYGIEGTLLEPITTFARFDIWSFNQ